MDIAKDYKFLVEGRPKPKERPRMTKRGRTYTPKATLDYEDHVRNSYSGPLFVGPVGLYVVLHNDHSEVTVWQEEWSSPLRGDVDNYLKALLDGLQGKAFDNDRQVHYVAVEKR